jgi:hypothetical protein
MAKIPLDGSESPEERSKYITQVLELIKKRGVRLKTAQQHRRELAAFFAKSEEPSGPALIRLNFIRETAMKVIKLLGEAGTAYNIAYGGDLIVVADLIDILDTTKEMLKNA